MGEKIYILHDEPALAAERQHSALADLAPFGLDDEYEQLWLGDLGDGTFELRCIPFRVYGLSLRDRVTVADGLVTGLAEPAGHRTLRALIVPDPPGASLEEVRDGFIRFAREEDLLIEWSGDRHVAIDFPPGRKPASLSELLLENQRAGNIAWEWSAGQPFVAGRPVPLDQHVRCTLPQPVLDSPGREEVPGAWLSHETAAESVMMQIPDVGAFVRALLPINLAGGGKITYGVWLAIDPEELPRIFSAWWAPEYADLEINGFLANPVPPWGLLGAPVQAVVRDVDETPYCAHSAHPELERVLTAEWPLDVVSG